MKRDKSNTDLVTKDHALDLVLGESNGPKIYSHAVFCQCILPVRSLPQGETYYQVEHGNTSLIIQSGIIRSESGQVHKMEVPAGPKARLLFPYIIDQAKRTGNPVIDMGASLHEYMLRNNIPVGGANAKEITRQVRNIGASNIYLGIWGETETHKFSSQKNYRVASEISFWTEKQPDQLSIWSPYLTVSDEFMAAIENHCVLLDLQPLVKLQANPRAMDIYTWLSYRIQTVRYPVKISYENLHHVFGKQTKAEKDFKKNFKAAIKQALPYVPDADVDMESDGKHVILKNISRSSVYLSDKPDSNQRPEISGVFGELKDIGLSAPVIKKIAAQYEAGTIKKAAALTKQNIEAGKIKNPAGFFTKALKEGWEPVTTEVEKGKGQAGQGAIAFDPVVEAKIKPVSWRSVRKKLYDNLGEAIFVSWIHNLSFVSHTQGKVVLKANNRFAAQTVETQYLDKLTQAWEEVTGEGLIVQVGV